MGTAWVGPLGTTDALSTPNASGATSTAPDDSGGMDSAPPPAVRPAGRGDSAGERAASGAGLPPAGDAAPRPAPLGILGPVGRQLSLDHARAAGWVHAPARGRSADDLAAGPAADRVYDSVDELARAMQAQLATLAGSPAFAVWSRRDPTFKPRLSGFLAIPQGTWRATVLLDASATHCARLAGALCLPPSAHPGPASI